jgi:hypothetical protein
MNWISKPQVFAEGATPGSADETIINGAPYDGSPATRDSLAERTPDTSAVPEDQTAEEIERRRGSLAATPAMAPLGTACPNL